MNILKQAMAGADVVVRLGGFKMLSAIIQLHVACGDRLVRFVIVFDVIGAQPRVAVTDIHVPVCAGHLALAHLRFRSDFRDLALARGRANLLSPNDDTGNARSRAEKCRQVEEATDPSMNRPRMMIHAIHAMDESKTIA